jgi:hypothetical protein
VDELLSQAVRASSAVEGVNSVVRMHQGRLCTTTTPRTRYAPTVRG